MVLSSWPRAPIQAPVSPPRAVEPVSEIQKGFLRELLDRAVGRQEQVGRRGPRQALAGAEVVGVGADEVDLLGAREVHRDRVLLVVRHAAGVDAPEQLDLVARRSS